MPALTELETVCNLCACGTVGLETYGPGVRMTQYNEPVRERIRFEAELMAPVGAQHSRTEVDTSDRNQVREFWDFWLLPDLEHPIKVLDRLFFAGCCFEIRSINPVLVKCCGRLKIHHYEIMACSVEG